jgi:hypothetical protein
MDGMIVPATVITIDPLTKAYPVVVVVDVVITVAVAAFEKVETAVVAVAAVLLATAKYRNRPVAEPPNPKANVPAVADIADKFNKHSKMYEPVVSVSAPFVVALNACFSTLAVPSGVV